MAASEAERTLEAVIVAMEQSMEKLQRNLDSYWREYGEQALAKSTDASGPTSSSSSGSGQGTGSDGASSSGDGSSSSSSSSKAGRASFRFHCLLDTTSRVPLQEICGHDDGDMQDGSGSSSSSSSSNINALPADIACLSEVLRGKRDLRLHNLPRLVLFLSSFLSLFCPSCSNILFLNTM